MNKVVSCPSCHELEVDLCQYHAMAVIRSDLALFTLECPSCKSVFSAVYRIPYSLRAEIDSVALEVGAGMGRS